MFHNTKSDSQCWPFDLHYYNGLFFPSLSSLFLYIFSFFLSFKYLFIYFLAPFHSVGTFPIILICGQNQTKPNPNQTLWINLGGGWKLKAFTIIFTVLPCPKTKEKENLSTRFFISLSVLFFFFLIFFSFFQLISIFFKFLFLLFLFSLIILVLFLFIQSFFFLSISALSF